MNPPENTTKGSIASNMHVPDPVRSNTHPVASPWHTALLIAILIGFSLLGARSQHTFTLRHGRLLFYSMTMAAEWVLVGYILVGIRQRGLRLRNLVGGRWASLQDVVRDMAIAVLFWLVALFVLGWAGYALGLARAHAADEARRKLEFIVPHSHLELASFLALSATAGFCEEIIFRGYLQRQFAALTRNAFAAVVLQALIFGLGHGYEGRERMLLIALFGVMFGSLAYWRKSLRPGMLAHGLHDGIEGVLLRAKLL